MDSQRLKKVISKIDEVNSRDPKKIRVEDYEYPYELIYSKNLTDWVMKLKPQPSEALLIAARGQHMGRWTIPRDHYPPDRGGYLRWREELKKFHAGEVSKIMKSCGYQESEIKPVQDIILKKNRTENSDSQTMEDALCLVFLESQFGELRAKTPDEKMKTILQKTWKKMSEAAKKEALNLDLQEKDKKLLREALP